MTIRVVRNDAGNCINFYGTSNPTYWNACLSASIDETFPTRINVRNDIRSAEEGTDVFEFYQIPYTTFLDKEGNSFESPAEAAQYITDNANVSGDTGTYIFSETETLDAQREDTNTTVLFSNGDSYAVNALRAVDADNGTITIRTVRADKDIYTNIRYYNVTVNDGAVSFNTVAAAVDRLNEVLTGGAVGTEGGDVTGGVATDSALTTFEVYGDRLVESGSGSTAGYTSTAEAGNFDTSNGILSVESISEAGEFFEFSQDSGDWTNTVGLTFGLFDETTYNRSDLEVDEPGNAVKAILRLRVKNSGFLFKDPDSTYGRLNEAGLQNQLDTRTTFRVGLDTERRGYIAMQLEDGSFQNVGRTETAIAADTVLKFLAIFPLANELNGVRNMTVNTISTAPALTWHYIESPDGAFYYPLFATAEEANYVDEQYGTAAQGAGASHSHIFPDEQPTVNTWYMPSTYAFHAQASAPTLANVTYNEISTGADSAHAPSELTLSNQNWSENYGVNLQIVPQDSEPATVTGLPSGLTYSNGYITGTTPYVPEDTDYTVTVVRSNAYGSTTQTFTITIQDNASLGDIAGFTELDGNYVQPNRVILTHDALLQYDTQLNPGEELTYSYSQNPPTIGILSAAGETNLAAFDPATDTLGTTGGGAGDMGSDFAWSGQWDLRYVTFGGSIGGTTEKFLLTGWANNSTIGGGEGLNIGVEFKLEYGLDGYIKLYRNNTLLLTSASTFTGAQTLTFAGFDNQAQSDLYIPSNLTIANSAAGTTTPPSGFTDPVESGTMSTHTLFGDGTNDGAVVLTQTLEVNHRYIVSDTWIEANVLPYIAGTGAGVGAKKFYFGVAKSTADFSTINELNNFHAGFRLEGDGNGNSHTSRLFINGTSATDSLVSISSPTDAYYQYGIEWDGTALHIIACDTNDLNTTPAIADGGTFVRLHTVATFGADNSLTNQSLQLAIAIKDEAQVNLTTTGLNQIRTPFGAQTILAGENSNGTGDFKVSPSNADYDSVPNGHAPADFTYADITSLSAGQTYKFIYHPSMEATDYIEFRLASDNTTVYTTGITTFDNAPSSDPQIAGGYKGLTFAVPADAPPLRLYHYNSYQSGSYDNGRAVSISGSTYTVPVTGVTIEGPAANFTGNVINATTNGWISLNETLSAGERLVLDSAFIQDLNSALPDHCIFWVGLKANGWTNTAFPTSSFFGGTAIRFYNTGGSEPGLRMFGYANGGTSSQIYSASLTGSSAFLEITSTGNNIRVGYTHSSSYNATTTAFADWDGNTKIQTGDRGYGIGSLDVVLYWQALGSNTTGFDISDVDWTGLSEVSNPAPAPSLTTSWNKALDFSGSAERARQVSAGSAVSPLRMADTVATRTAPTAGNTTSGGHPWATAIVFSSDNNYSNQHIWNQGEGAGSTDDNIYLRVDSIRNLYFGWGRSGALNECSLGTLASGSGHWYGIYVAHNGTRLSGANATAANLAACFDIRGINLQTGSVGSQMSTATNWVTTGGRMDRSYTGDFTIGGRGSNRNFHGKIASMVVTTLKNSDPMPTDAEISMMVRDPQQWVTDYKVNRSYRRPHQTYNTGNFLVNSQIASYSTQVWLMGDGTNDAYAHIRNQIWASSQNYTPLNMLSMVSNDIETVNIPGLT